MVPSSPSSTRAQSSSTSRHNKPDLSIEKTADRRLLSGLLSLTKSVNLRPVCVTHAHVDVPGRQHPNTPAPPAIMEDVGEAHELVTSKASATLPTRLWSAQSGVCRSLLGHLGLPHVVLDICYVTHGSPLASGAPSTSGDTRCRRLLQWVATTSAGVVPSFVRVA